MKFYKVEIFCTISGSGNSGDKAQRSQESSWQGTQMFCPVHMGTHSTLGSYILINPTKNLLF